MNINYYRSFKDWLIVFVEDPNKNISIIKTITIALTNALQHLCGKDVRETINIILSLPEIHEDSFHTVLAEHGLTVKATYDCEVLIVEVHKI